MKNSDDHESENEIKKANTSTSTNQSVADRDHVHDQVLPHDLDRAPGRALDRAQNHENPLKDRKKKIIKVGNEIRFFVTHLIVHHWVST